MFIIVRIKEFFRDCISIFRSVFMVAAQAFDRRETQMYPEVPYIPSSRYRGRIILTSSHSGNNKERCVACNLCAVSCPVDCISLKKGEREDGSWYPEVFRINFSRCIFCGMCEEACPTGAIQLTQDFDMCEFDRSNLVYEKENLLVSHEGKYVDYDFYQISGVSIHGKGKGLAKNEASPVNVKSIMP